MVWLDANLEREKDTEEKLKSLEENPGRGNSWKRKLLCPPPVISVAG